MYLSEDVSYLIRQSPYLPLRRRPTEEQLEQIRLEREKAGALYRSAGADAAREFLKGTLLSQIIMPYPVWARAFLLQGQPPPVHRWGLCHET